MEQPKLLLRGVSKSFRQGRQVMPTLQEVDLEVAQGEFVSLIGPSGCGKSTLFTLVAGLEQMAEQIVRRQGQGAHTRRRWPENSGRRAGHLCKGQGAIKPVS